jgi:hypothetical protein
MGVEECNPVALSAAFYKEFLYGSTETRSISRGSLLNVILNLMMEKMGESRLGHLFTSGSYYTKLSTVRSLTGKTRCRPAILRMALEALDPELLSEEDPADDSDTPPEAPEPDVPDDTAVDPTKDPTTAEPVATDSDPQTDVGGFDPSTPFPAVPVSVVDQDKNTIDLISFDKSGEGVNEDLYRSAVVALNDRLRSDDSLSIKAEVREALTYWVNGFLYRTAISATQDQIAYLRLQHHLKNVLTKG